MITLSIIIPAFNAQAYIKRCLDSILSQDIQNNTIEIIIINDGSTDCTQQICETYVGDYDHIFLYNTKNEGVSCARNMGIRNALGEYVLFVDADDELCDNSLSILLDFLMNNTVDMLVTNQIDILQSCTRRRKKPKLDVHRVYSGVAAFNNGYLRYNAGGAICRRNAVIELQLEFPPHIKNSEDTIFFGVLQQFVDRIVYIDLDFYKIHLENISASRQSEYNKTINLIDTINAFSKIKQNISSRTNEDKLCVIEGISYLLLSNLTNAAVLSGFGCVELLKFAEINQLLPIKMDFSQVSGVKVLVINLSFRFFYFLTFIKYHLK